MEVARAWGDRGRITGWWIWFVMVLCWRTTTPEVVTRLSCSCMARRVIGVFGISSSRASPLLIGSSRWTFAAMAE